MTDNALAMAQSALVQISSLRSSVDMLTAQLHSLDARVHAQGGTVTQQGQAITTITSTITSEASARASADDALATRVGAISCHLSDEKADAHATSRLTGRATSAEESTLEVFPGQAVETLRLGKVTFYGESARVIRDAQAVLESAGAGQLEVVKRESRDGQPFVVSGGRVFISEAAVDMAAVEPSKFSIKTEEKDGRIVIAGIGVQTEKPKVILAQELLDEIQKQISESNLGKSLVDRLNAIELGRVTQKGLDEAAAARLGQRIDALQAQVDNLQSKVYSSC